MKEIKLEAKTENLDNVLAILEEELEAVSCPPKIVMQMSIAVEEIFVNIAHYAYGDDVGMATVQIDTADNKAKVVFIDKGTQYDPLAKEDPDITLSAEERPIGGLGIYMVKKSMDDVTYRYEDGKNILTIVKNL